MVDGCLGLLSVSHGCRHVPTHHEINLVFAVHIAAPDLTSKEDQLEFYWLPLRRLAGMDIRPAAPKDALLTANEYQQPFWRPWPPSQCDGCHPPPRQRTTAMPERPANATRNVSGNPIRRVAQALLKAASRSLIDAYTQIRDESKDDKRMKLGLAITAAGAVLAGAVVGGGAAQAELRWNKCGGAIENVCVRTDSKSQGDYLNEVTITISSARYEGKHQARIRGKGWSQTSKAVRMGKGQTREFRLEVKRTLSNQKVCVDSVLGVDTQATACFEIKE